MVFDCVFSISCFLKGKQDYKKIALKIQKESTTLSSSIIRKKSSRQLNVVDCINREFIIIFFLDFSKDIEHYFSQLLFLLENRYYVFHYEKLFDVSESI